MEFIQHNDTVAELTSSIQHVEDSLDVIGNLSYQGFDTVIIPEALLAPAFFDLKTGLAGEILQKFTNYHMRVVIVGQFETCTGKSIRDFMYESNKGRQVNFVASAEQALETTHSHDHNNDQRNNTAE